MKSNPVAWFELYVQDMPRAKVFYESVFETKLEKLNNPEVELWAFPMEMNQYGAGGALVKMDGVSSGGNSTLVYFSCDDCAIEESRVVPAGGRTPAQTDWPRIAALYDALAQTAPSPVVELNRAVALAMAFGPAAGLAHADTLTHEPTLAHYHLLPSVRGDLLAKLGRANEASAEFHRAAALTQNTRERALLLERAAACTKA